MTANNAIGSRIQFTTTYENGNVWAAGLADKFQWSAMQLTSTQINILNQLIQCMLAHHIDVVAFDAKCEQKQCETRQFARENYFGESVWCDFYIKRALRIYKKIEEFCLKCVLCDKVAKKTPEE